ncbi:MAG: hypothetical protein ACOY3I_00180 [Verrucomicrobiota bacterium]
MKKTDPHRVVLEKYIDFIALETYLQELYRIIVNQPSSWPKLRVAVFQLARILPLQFSRSYFLHPPALVTPLVSKAFQRRLFSKLNQKILGANRMSQKEIWSLAHTFQQVWSYVKAKAHEQACREKEIPLAVLRPICRIDGGAECLVIFNKLEAPKKVRKIFSIDPSYSPTFPFDKWRLEPMKINGQDGIGIRSVAPLGRNILQRLSIFEQLRGFLPSKTLQHDHRLLVTEQPKVDSLMKYCAEKQCDPKNVRDKWAKENGAVQILSRALHPRMQPYPWRDQYVMASKNGEIYFLADISLSNFGIDDEENARVLDALPYKISPEDLARIPALRKATFQAVKHMRNFDPSFEVAPQYRIDTLKALQSSLRQAKRRMKFHAQVF